MGMKRLSAKLFFHYICPSMNDPISFDNTEIAFAYKSKPELKKAHFLFSLMGQPWIVKMGTRLAPWSIKAGLPVKGLIRNTIFSQFVGGETLEETIPVAQLLGKYGVQVILDYGVEGKVGEANFDHACLEFIRVIEYAATQPNIPFMSIKVTGFARFALLEKIDAAMTALDGTLMRRYAAAVSHLPEAEKMLPTAICTPWPSSARFRRNESKSSSSSIQSMNPPCGRMTRVPTGK